MIETTKDISGEVGYDIIHCNNDDIKPVNSLESDSQEIVIFDDFIYDKNQKPLRIISYKGATKPAVLFAFHNHFIKLQKMSD